MNFEQMLKALQDGKRVQRTFDGPILEIQQATIPILVTGLIDSAGPHVQSISNNWLMTKFPVIANCARSFEAQYPIGAPYAFSDEERSATNWRIVE